VSSFVLIAEIVNTAMELSLDFLNGKGYHPSVKMIKDIVAGAVFIACINAVIIGCVIFLPHLIR
jgi:diacylglycerol kinase